MDVSGIRRAYLDFFVERGHVEIPAASLVPREDPTTLFTGSGMQPLIPYLLGADHPAGSRLVDSQPCFRAEDIDEVGDSRHTTFFEMLGNWSLGEYFKADQLDWAFEFFIDVIGLDPSRLYATAFGGASEYGIARDDESAQRCAEMFGRRGIEASITEMGSSDSAARLGMRGGRVFFYDSSENWWTRAGTPEAMPPGEPGGPDSELFFEFVDVEHDAAFGTSCHVHCDCGRFIEIGNSVFMEYVRTDSGFAPLPRRNVDFGGGLERIAMASAGTPDIFGIDSLRTVVNQIEQLSGASYVSHTTPMRIVADHIRAVVFLAANGVSPSNTAQGYVMRRFARRAMRQGLLFDIESGLLTSLLPAVVQTYVDHYRELASDQDRIADVLEREEVAFRRTLSRGIREFPKLAGDRLTGAAVFTLFDTHGFPPELSLEEATTAGVDVDPAWKHDYDARMAEQRERSRTASAGTFRGGLADQSEETTKLHTATHLLYKALRNVLGDHVVQRGSNITPERLRFDFSHPQKMTPEEIEQVEAIVNDVIDRDLPMTFAELPTEEAFGQGALGAFGDKYGATVRVYTAGDPDGEWYSKEICGGPHVQRTRELGKFKVVKEESSSAGARRIRAKVEPAA